VKSASPEGFTYMYDLIIPHALNIEGDIVMPSNFIQGFLDQTACLGLLFRSKSQGHGYYK